jgi:hypothetical protein
MYVSAHRVMSPATGNRGVNIYLYVHGPVALPPTPEVNPGTLWMQDLQLQPPGGNRVLSYLDILTSDALPLESLRGYLAVLKHTMVENGNPSIAKWGPLWIRFGLGNIGIPWATELGALAGHLVLRLPYALG